MEQAEAERVIKQLAQKFKRVPKEEFLKECVELMMKYDANPVKDACRLIWRRNKHFPTLKELYDAIVAELPKYEKKPQQVYYKPCFECDNQGYFIVINPAKGYTTVASCSCARGVDLRNKYPRFDDCAALGYTRKLKEHKSERRGSKNT